MGNLSKRAILSESEKIDLTNKIEMLNFTNEDLTHKYNELSAELQRRVTLKEFMKQTGDLKRKLEEADIEHHHQLEAVSDSLKVNKRLLVNFII